MESGASRTTNIAPRAGLDPCCPLAAIATGNPRRPQIPPQVLHKALHVRSVLLLRSINALVRENSCSLPPAVSDSLVMETASDAQLLRQFAASHAEAAFAALVSRHLNHVHAVAWRVTRSPELAADVAQQVFARLAQRARLFPWELSLSSWLHRTTRSLAIDLVRSETARRRREEAFHHHRLMNDAPSADWAALEPLLDQAVASLPAADREAILLRFYRNLPHAEIGRCLAVSEDAARMRVHRSLEKLRQRLARQGLHTSAAALALTLPAHAASTAPPPLAAAISAAISTSAAPATLAALLAMTKTQIAAAALALAAPIIALQFYQNRQQSREIAALRRSAPSPSSSLAPALASPASSQPAGRLPSPPPQTSLREILAQRDPVNRMRALLDFVAQIPPGALPSALKEIRENSPDWDPEAKVVLHLLLTRWAQQDPEAALASLNSLDPKKQGGDAPSILASLAARDPQRVAAWLANSKNTLVDFPVMGAILAGTLGKEWVRQDPAAALAWARRLPESQRGGAYVGVLGTLASTDPAAAARLASQLDADPARLHVLGDIGKSWAKKSPSEALAWANSLNGAERQTALRQALGSWSDTAPAAAARFLEDLPAAVLDGPLLKSVAEPWVAKAPDAAATWLAARPDSTAKNEAMGSVLWNWTKQNPNDASTWLTNQPSGPARDAAINGLALATFDSDPASALTWAASISDETNRAASVTLGITEWLKRDAPAARSWASSRGLALPGGQAP